ncbi:MAG: single-stranded-DNA-specific exonuclease RecJ, partial [Coprococcus sp.]
YILLLGLRRTWAALHGSCADDCTVVDYDIPHRVHDGYGINKRLIDAAIADGVDTIITCDNGIAAIEQVRYAKERGLTVIVTDHHQIPFEESDGGERIYMLPQADAVIDNQRQDCEYPFKGLCGAGVAFKLIQYMYRICGIAESEVNEFMEILGLATNCDMMDLVDENRLYVKYALESLKDSRNPGLNALMMLSGRNEKKISTYDQMDRAVHQCGGRLGDAKQSLEFCLREIKCRRARAGNRWLSTMRKSMTGGWSRISRYLETATVKEVRTGGYPCGKVLVVYIPAVHESVVGIIASRLKEAYTRPVMVFTDAETPGILKGSGRSIDSYNMFEELNRFREMFTAFGGHAMAAGFSIEKERLDELRRKLNEAAVLTDEDITPKLMIDVAMPLAYNSIELTEQIERLEPYGKGNRKPLFAQAAVPVRRAQILGRNKNLLKLQLDTGYGRCVDAIDFDPDTFVNNIKQWFGEDECVKMLNGQPNAVVIDVAYYPTINEYMGRRSLQMKMEAYNKGI